VEIHQVLISVDILRTSFPDSDLHIQSRDIVSRLTLAFSGRPTT
jgi:hypothetical protein